MDGYGNILHLLREDHHNEVIDILNDNKLAVMERFVDCVDIAYNLALDYIPVLFIPDGEIEMGMEPQDFMEKLQLAEEYFITIEDYDMCQRIVDIRGRISHTDI